MKKRTSGMATMAIVCLVLLIPCMSFGAAGEWTWMSGSNVVYQSGVYGTKGTPDAANVPGARSRSISWTDSDGNLWLFGGYGLDSANRGYLNDLWRYNPVDDMWTWVSGSNVINQDGVYGVKGTPDAANVPGARDQSISWIDGDGNLWLFAGYGRDSTGTLMVLNDLWRYDPVENMWTWMSGVNSGIQVGVYGTRGTPDAANMPGSRHSSNAWTDSAGKLWLFGGNGYTTSTTRSGYLKDLWRYDPVETMWTWVSGPIARSQAGTYGEQGIPDAANVPGSRSASISWIDSDDNLWLFGGYGCDAWYGGGTFTRLNDLWRYDPVEDMWTWMSGSKTGNQLGVYGEKGAADGANVPGARNQGVSWIDSAGNLLLFGGQGYAVDGYFNTLNDFWRYDRDPGVWTWIGGSDTGNEGGSCSAKGMPDADNMPGARFSSISWTDKGLLWLLGGSAYDCNAGYYYHNDLWLYEVPGCATDSDCDDGIFCNGAETCDNSTCVAAENPCDNSTSLCDEENDRCVECLDDGDCDDDGLYCTGDPLCDEGLCDVTGNPCDNATPVCDESGETCVECLDDGDCAESDYCSEAVCMARCELIVKHKKIRAAKLFKPRKVVLKITSEDAFFDIYGQIDLGPLTWEKVRFKDKKGTLKIKAIVPAGLEPGVIPISVGDCAGEVVISGFER